MIQGIKRCFTLILFATVLTFTGFTQGTSEKAVAPHNWHELDRAETGFYGISLDKAYSFLKNKMQSLCRK